jgi:hypothetical protein
MSDYEYDDDLEAGYDDPGDDFSLGDESSDAVMQAFASGLRQGVQEAIQPFIPDPEIEQQWTEMQDEWQAREDQEHAVQLAEASERAQALANSAGQEFDVARSAEDGTLTARASALFDLAVENAYAAGWDEEQMASLSADAPEAFTLAGALLENEAIRGRALNVVGTGGWDPINRVWVGGDPS